MNKHLIAELLDYLHRIERHIKTDTPASRDAALRLTEFIIETLKRF